MTTILEKNTDDDSNDSTPMGLRAAAVLVAKTTAHHRRAQFAVLPSFTSVACEKQGSSTRNGDLPATGDDPMLCAAGDAGWLVSEGHD